MSTPFCFKGTPKVYDKFKILGFDPLTIRTQRKARGISKLMLYRCSAYTMYMYITGLYVTRHDLMGFEQRVFGQGQKTKRNNR